MWTFPATSYSCTTSGRLPPIVPALAVVPPMSKLMISCRPTSSPSQAEAMTPEAGPDSTMVAGLSATTSALAIPPLDCIT